MGMDVYGLNPVLKGARPEIDWSSNPSEEEKQAYFKASDAWHAENQGAYFRNNVWWWHPLWEFVCIACDDVLSEEAKHKGTFNEGYQYDAETALIIADRLKEALEGGSVQVYAEQRQAHLDSLPLETCNLCNGTGVRDDEYVQGKCNNCDGTGKVKNWDAHYPFDADNVKEFEQFCRLSGGFEIC